MSRTIRQYKPPHRCLNGPPLSETSSNNVTLRSERRVKKMQFRKKRKIVTEFTEKKIAEQTIDEHELCSICSEDCEGKICILDCGHEFHTKCIFTWFKKKNNCPMCRAEVTEFVKEDGPNMLFPPYGFLEIVLNMTEESLRNNPPPSGIVSGEISSRVFAMAAISKLDDVLNSLTRAQYLTYCERARGAE